MNWFDKSFLVVYFLVIILVQCVWQYNLISNVKPINHLKHGFYYALTVLPMLYFFSPYYWQVIVIALLERAALFDIALNTLRGKPFYYNGAGGSWIDTLENKLGTKWQVYLKLFYVIIFIAAIIFIK